MRWANIRDEIQMKVKERVDKHQREYILREQLKLIREELGEDTTISDAEEFAQKAEALDAPDEVKEKLKKEISRFKNSMQSPAEAGVIRTYIEPCWKCHGISGLRILQTLHMRKSFWKQNITDWKR